MARSRKILIAVVVAAVVLIGGGAFYWWSSSDDAPAAPTLDSASKSVSTTTGSADGTGSSDGSADAGIDGTWKVDTSSGSFDFESATGTFAGFRIKENLSSIGSTEAVGRTGDVTGSMTIAGDQVTEAKFEVDLTTITTNQSLRDGRVQDALDTSQFPTATFELTEPIDLGPDAASGAEVSVTAKGDLTVHGETQSVEFPLQAKVVDGTVVVVGSLDVTFSDFGVEVPKAPVVVSVDDHGAVELQLLLTKS